MLALESTAPHPFLDGLNFNMYIVALVQRRLNSSGGKCAFSQPLLCGPKACFSKQTASTSAKGWTVAEPLSFHYVHLRSHMSVSHTLLMSSSFRESQLPSAGLCCPNCLQQFCFNELSAAVAQGCHAAVPQKRREVSWSPL